MEQRFQEFPEKRDAFLSTKIPVCVSRNFQKRMEQHIPGYPKKMGAFHSNKYSGVNFRKFTEANETELSD